MVEFGLAVVAVVKCLDRWYTVKVLKNLKFYWYLEFILILFGTFSLRVVRWFVLESWAGHDWNSRLARSTRAGSLSNGKLITLKSNLTLIRPLPRKLRTRWFFDVSKVKESIFLNRTSKTPSLQIFDAQLLENTKLSSSSFHFSVGF